jgi:tRNA(fMet)-specific endonuclease VapC
MKKILLDTNAYSGFMSGDQLVFDYLVEAEIIYLSTVMIGELFAGFHGGSKFTQNKNELKTFLSKEGVTIIDVSIETAEIFGEVKSQLRRKGKMIPLNDIWIASQAIETGAKLISYDAHFKNISGLRLWEELQHS